jgi:drug/metabolite transporter (DMT)-like permease
MSHANLFSSLCAVIIVAYRLATFEKVTKVEIIGTAIAIFGCVMTSFDRSADKADPGESNIGLGNFLSFLSSIFATIYILKGLEASRQLDPLKYLILLTFITTFIFLTVAPLIT